MNNQNQAGRRAIQGANNRPNESWGQYFVKLISSTIVLLIGTLFLIGVGVAGEFLFSGITIYFTQKSNMFDTLNQLKTPKTSGSLRKFYQNSIYDQIQKYAVLSKSKYQFGDKNIPLLYGRQKIGKTQNIIHFINKEIQSNLPVMFFSLIDYQIDTNEKFQQFLELNNNWNQIKKWRKQSQETFNTQYMKMFGNNTRLTVVIDEINAISQYCKKGDCQPIVQKFIKQLNALRQKGARIIALSSDSDNSYLRDISIVGNIFYERAIQLQQKKSFDKMFKDYKLYDEQLKNYILDHYQSRGTILKVLSYYQEQCKNDKVQLKIYIQSELEMNYKDLFSDLALSQYQNEKQIEYFKILQKACIQINSPIQYDHKISYQLVKRDILYGNEFKTQLYARAFQQYALKQNNQTIRCKQFKDYRTIEDSNEKKKIQPKIQTKLKDKNKKQKTVKNAEQNVKIQQKMTGQAEL